MSRLLPTSLTSRLVVTAVTLVALVSLLIAAATTLAIGSYLSGQLDSEVEQAAGRAVGASRGGPSFPLEELEERAEGRPPAVDAALGQPAGTVTAYVVDGLASGELVTSDREALAAEELAPLADVPADGEQHTIDIPGLGRYRALATDTVDMVVVAGLPTDGVDDTLASLIGWELLFTVLGVVVAGGVALLVVRRQLRPLRQVARTAHDVAGLPLSTGEIGVTARVPEELTDERTEVGRVGAALNTLLGHVEGALDSRHRSELQVRQFVADASHELRTPLATIQGYAELTRRAPDAGCLTHTMSKVESEASRMSVLVEDLLLLARLDAGRPLERNEVDLTKMVLESVGDARVVAPDHRWLLELTDEPVTVTGDAKRLHQVLTNLLSNARKHTPAGTTVIVGVRMSQDDRAAMVTVRDDGPGIPQDMQGIVFERFARGDSARTRESGGAGLGLSLARAIAAAHGGDIVVTSRPGDTCFILTLPRELSDPVPAEATQPHR